MIREMYTHTRNYGCRLRRYLYNGVEMLSLENRRLKAVVALGKGAGHRRTGLQTHGRGLYVAFVQPAGRCAGKPTVAASGGTFMDSYAGGWQDLFPTYGAARDLQRRGDRRAWRGVHLSLGVPRGARRGGLRGGVSELAHAAQSLPAGKDAAPVRRGAGASDQPGNCQ